MLARSALPRDSPLLKALSHSLRFRVRVRCGNLGKGACANSVTHGFDILIEITRLLGGYECSLAIYHQSSGLSTYATHITDRSMTP